VVIWFVPAPEGLEPRAWRMLAIFVATIAGIVLAPLPMSAIALIGATVASLLGVIKFSDVVKSNGTDLVWLILLAFFISRGVISTGLGRRVALVFLRLLGRRTVGLGYGMAVTELLIAPAMPSITARAGGVMLPITQSIAEALGSRPDEETRHRAGAYLIQCAFQANIVTAAMFVTAMAGNPLVVKLAADEGVEISWIGWAAAAFVPGVACLAVIPLVLLYLVPPQVRRTPDAVALANRELATMGAVSTKEIIMALIFVGLIAMWVFGDVMDIDATQAAAIGVAVMLVTGVLTWKDALAERAAWDTMVWIGILIMLAAKLNEYGLIAWLGKALGLYLQGYHRLLLFLLVGAVYFYSHYLFASATAHIGALYPIALALCITGGVAPFPAAVALACLSSLYGCLTQYAIGSGPVMFGAGYVSQAEWWRTGFVMSLVYLAIWFTLGPLWWTLLGLTHVKF
jgi:divalent anion:Na+ symporter, DASS family